MGRHTDARLADFQHRTGIRPATGQHAANLERLQQLAYGLLRLAELDRCGIRDGDGAWHGCDPIYETVARLAELVSDLDGAVASFAAAASGQCPGDAGGCMGDCVVCEVHRKPLVTAEDCNQVVF